jgi:hypothetical protein
MPTCPREFVERRIASRWKLGTLACCFELKAGEFIQGLLATISYHRRVYVVTVSTPEGARFDDRDLPLPLLMSEQEARCVVC